jgi:hypothetical protein
VEFEPTIPAFELAKTVHASDHTVSVIGRVIPPFLISELEGSAWLASRPCRFNLGEIYQIFCQIQINSYCISSHTLQGCESLLHVIQG